MALSVILAAMEWVKPDVSLLGVMFLNAPFILLVTVISADMDTLS